MRRLKILLDGLGSSFTVWLNTDMEAAGLATFYREKTLGDGDLDLVSV